VVEIVQKQFNKAVLKAERSKVDSAGNVEDGIDFCCEAMPTLYVSTYA
jgi:hypothetical protein